MSEADRRALIEVAKIIRAAIDKLQGIINNDKEK